MSVNEFVNGLNIEQLQYAKEQIELKLQVHKESKKIKFCSILAGDCRWDWCDAKDNVGMEILKTKYLEIADARWEQAISWSRDTYKSSDFNNEMPHIEFVTVSEVEYDGWLKDSVNPSYSKES